MSWLALSLSKTRRITQLTETLIAVPDSAEQRGRGAVQAAADALKKLLGR